jgi:predicted nucleic acid-binding protein
LEIKIIGTAGILLLAKDEKIIKSVKPVINDLKNAGYYLSDNLIKEVLKRG